MDKNEGMSFVEHFGELRKRLVRVAIVFVLTLVLGFVVSQPIITYLKSVPPATEFGLNVFSPWDSLRIYMNVSLLAAMILTLPFTLFQLWGFVKPGLRDVERGAVVYYIPLAFVLALCGLAFAYFIVFPMAFAFTSFLSGTLGVTETYGISQYFSFMFNILIPITFVFEMPVVVLFLTKIHLLTPNVLKKVRKVAYVVLVVISTLITPPDLVSALIVAVPLILLYEISIFFSNRIYRKQQVAKEARLRA